MTARTAPPGKRRGRPRQETGHPVATATADGISMLPRWCRFTGTYCRCQVEPIETANMSVCAAHFLHDAEGWAS